MNSKIKYYLNANSTAFKFSKYYNKKSNLNGYAAELMRNTHSIEKGLSIKNVRLGFGHKKQEYMMDLIKKLENSNDVYHKEAIKMAISALNSYLVFHNGKNYQDEFMDKIKEFLKNRKDNIIDNYGGVIEYNTKNNKINIDEIENLFNTRHSIRTFSKEPVDDNILKNAIKLAQRAPSACNRQGVRVYVVDKSRSAVLKKQLAGIGGFADEIDKFVIITGKISSYKYGEPNQFIVSAGIYVGYLTLSLHAYGLGACVIQRPVIWNKNCEEVKKEYNIENDEQIVCLIGVGNIDGKVNVPISHRINIDEFVKFIN